jgi:hypothetical protein
MLLARLKIAAAPNQRSVRKTAREDGLQVGRGRTVETRSSTARWLLALREHRRNQSVHPVSAKLLANCEEFRPAEPNSKVSDLPGVTEKLAVATQLPQELTW